MPDGSVHPIIFPQPAPDAGDLLAALKAGTCRTPLSCRLMSVALGAIDNTRPGNSRVHVPAGIEEELNEEALRLPAACLDDVIAVLGMLGQLSANLHSNFEDDSSFAGKQAVYTAAQIRKVLDAAMPFLLRQTSLTPVEVGLHDFSSVIEDAAHAHLQEHIARWTTQAGVGA